MEKWKSNSGFAKINKIVDIASFLLVISLIGITLITWGRAPDIVPTHYNINGIADGYGSKNTIFIIIPIVIILYLGLAILSKYPQIYNYAIEINPRNKERQYDMAVTFVKIINLEMVLLFLCVQTKIAISMVTNAEHMSMSFIFLLMIILFGSIGVYIYKSIKSK